MFLTVFLFELRYQLRRPVTWLFFAVFFLMAFFSTASEGFIGIGTGQIHRNAPFVLATAIGVLTAIGQVITTALAGTAVLRDAQLGTQELLFTTRLSRAGYLCGRFLGAFVAMVIIYSAMPLGLLLGSLMPWVPADKLGPVSLWNVIQPFLLIALPNLLFISALLFAVGSLTRKLFSVYVTGIALLLVWQISQNVIRNLDRLKLGSLIDPFGITTVDIATRYWTVAEKNSRLVPLDANVLANRGLWVAIAIGLFAMVYALFRLRLQGGGAGKRKRATVSEPSAPAPAPAVTTPQFTLSFDRPANWRQLLSLAAFHFRVIVREPVFLAIMAIGVINLLINVWYTVNQQDTVYWPVTATLAPSAVQSMFLFMVIVSTLYGGELIWKERQQRADQMHDALPVPVWVSLGGKCIGLALVMLLLGALAILATAAFQAIMGYFRFEPLLYAQVYLASVVPLVVGLVPLTVGVHALVNQKFVGHLIIIVYFVGLSVMSNLGFDHRLYQVGIPSSFTYSDMNGWGPYVPRIVTQQAYYIAVSMLLCVAGGMLLVRGSDATWRERRRQSGARWAQGGFVATAVLATIALAFGGVFYWNANMLNDYSEVRKSEKAVAAWEREWKPLEELPQPRIVGTTIEYDAYPERRSAAWRGTLTAVNRHDRAIDTLFVQLPATAARPQNSYTAAANTGLVFDTLEFSRPVSLVVNETGEGVRLYRLAEPLAPGDTLLVRFAARYEPRGFPNDGFANDVAVNGTFMNNSYMPGFGYNPQGELSDDDIRERNKLAPKPRMKSIDDTTARRQNYISNDTDWMAFEATLSTSADQIAIAPGYLQREWTENSRRYFHYVMDQPILGFYSFLSARYAVKKEDYKGTSLEIYYHPWHTFALESMLQASKDGLDYFGANFSPYQYRQYRILEFPRYQGFAQAFPNTIPFSEGIGFLMRNKGGDDGVDRAYFVAAHELAHQWWAHQVVGANAQGATTFSEGLAEYSALTVLEKRYGREATQKFLRRELDGYLQGRGVERKKEVPFLYVENQPYIHYQKGSLVYFALRDYIGEAAMNQGLSSFLKKWAFQGPPYPTARDLYAELDAVTPDSLKYVLTDLFEEITLFDNKAVSATSTKRPDGRYDVRLTVQAKKLKADSLGGTQDVPMVDYVDIGIFGDEVKGQKLGVPLLVQKVKITEPETTLDFVVDQEPRKAGIDPYNILIDRTPEDNLTAVQ